MAETPQGSGDSPVTLTAHGAAECVGNTKILNKIGGFQSLVDNGKDYSGRDSDNEVKSFPFNPKEIDILINTHAHADHTGDFLPFVKRGFSGPIYATPETIEIARQQLEQEAKSPFIHNRIVKGKRMNGKSVPRRRSIYTDEDVEAVMSLFRNKDGSMLGFPYRDPIKVNDSLTITFFDAGHIPGSAQVFHDIKYDGRNVRLMTTFDLGRTDYRVASHPVADIPIVTFPDTDLPKNIEHVVIESTYGDKVHGKLEDSLKMFEQAINDAYKNKGVLVIPSFSIMRTQMIWNLLFRMEKQGTLPKGMKFYSSSPSADGVANIFLKYMDRQDVRAQKEFANADYNPFNFPSLIRHKKLQETRDVLESAKPPYAMIASSGMCEGGRIVPVLEATLGNPRNIVLLTGYCAPSTKGGRLLAGAKEINFYDNIVPVRAEIRKMGGLSGHCDSEENIAHLKHMRNPKRDGQFKGIYIMHGDKGACWKLREKVINAGYHPDTVHVMKQGQAYPL